MPTHAETDEFWADWDRLTPRERALFKVAVGKFQHDLAIGEFRPGLRVKRYQSRPGTWEMTWAPDGRALFRYGEPVRSGHRHVIWQRIGNHKILDAD
jgi:hypothetical protein